MERPNDYFLFLIVYCVLEVQDCNWSVLKKERGLEMAFLWH